MDTETVLRKKNGVPKDEGDTSKLRARGSPYRWKEILPREEEFAAKRDDRWEKILPLEGLTAGKRLCH